MTEPKPSPGELQAAIEQALEQPMTELCDRLAAEFDKELRGYIAVFEAGAELRPDKPEAPGLRAAAQILRKAMESDDAP